MLLPAVIRRIDLKLNILVCSLLFLVDSGCVGKEYFDAQHVTKLKPPYEPSRNEVLAAKDGLSNIKAFSNLNNEPTFLASCRRNQLPVNIIPSYDPNNGYRKKKCDHLFLSSTSKPAKCKDRCDLKIDTLFDVDTAYVENRQNFGYSKEAFPPGSSLWADKHQFVLKKRDAKTKANEKANKSVCKKIKGQLVSKATGKGDRGKKGADECEDTGCDKCTPISCMPPLCCTSPCCRPGFKNTCPEKVTTPCPCPCCIPCQPLKDGPLSKEEPKLEEKPADKKDEGSLH